MSAFRRLCPLLLLLAGCSGSDNPAGPGPVPAVPPVVESFLVTDPSVLHGSWTSLRWRINGATVASIAPDVGEVSNPTNGAASVRPYQTTLYTITASNAHGTVTAQVSVDVQYLAGLFVDSVHGDDARSGATPALAIRTLGEALNRTQGGGAIFLSAGTYDTPIVIDGAERTIYGGLNPTTFFEDADTYRTRIQPTGAGVPLTIRNASAGISLFSFVELDAKFGGAVAVDVDDSNVIFEDCLVDGRFSNTGTALLVHGTSDIQALRCRIQGGRKSPSHSETRGVAVLDAASVLLHSCFVDGGAALTRSSGVDVFTTGSVRLGFNTISAQLTGGAGADVAAAILLRGGRPAIGGNILFTRWSGPVQHHAIVEASADADPSWLLGNLFITAGVPPYDNFSSDGADPSNEAELNDPQFVNAEDSSVYLNRLDTSTTPAAAFVNPDLSNYHLISPLQATLMPNPAVDRGDAMLLDADRFGASTVDIDGAARPGYAAGYDLGADEH